MGLGNFLNSLFGNKSPKKDEYSELIDAMGGQEKFDRDNENHRRWESVLHIPEVVPCKFDESVSFWYMRLYNWCEATDPMNIIYEDIEGHKTEARSCDFLGVMEDSERAKELGQWHFEKKSIKSFIAFRIFIDSSGKKRKETYFVELNLDNNPENPYRKAEQDQQNQTETIQQEVDKSPYEVLGISEQATVKEIREAFKKKALENHPDRTAGLGEEYKQLAEKRMKEINFAYEQLRKENN